MSVKRSGQTLLELVIAAGVISVSVIASLTLIVHTLDLARQSQNAVEAGNYAREGIEIVRMLRDSNWLDIDDNGQRCGALTAWDSDGSTGPTCGELGVTNQNYIAAYTPGTGWALQGCTGACTGTQTQLLRVSAGSVYTTQSLSGIVGSKPLDYHRTITITPGTEAVTIGSTVPPYSLQYLDVGVTITWSSSSKHVVMHEKLYNWR